MSDLVYRLKKRAEIRRQIPNRKSVVNGESDRIADLLEEAAENILFIEAERDELKRLADEWCDVSDTEKLLASEKEKVEELERKLGIAEEALIVAKERMLDLDKSYGSRSYFSLNTIWKALEKIKNE